MNSSVCIKIRFAATVLLLTFWTATGLGQSVPHYGSTGGPLEFGANYSWLHANAPAGNCGCFSASSGSGNVVLNAPHAISAVGEISGYQANRISGSTQNVTILNYLFGGRYSLGGGVHVPVGRHLGINIVQADWLHSTLPNAANNRQNDLRLGTGIYLVLGSR